MIRQFIKHVGIVFTGEVAQRILSFLLMILLSYTLLPNELGEYNAVFAAVTSAYILTGFGAPMVIQRYSAAMLGKDHENIGPLLFSGYVLMFLTLVLVVVLLMLLESWLIENVFGPEIEPYYHLIPVLLVFYFLAYSPLTTLLGLHDFPAYAKRNMVVAGITLLCVGIGSYLNGLSGTLVGLLVSQVLSAIYSIGTLAGTIKAKEIRLRVIALGKNILWILKKGFPFYVGNTFIGALTNFVLIGLFVQHIGYDEYGFLRIGLSLVALISVIPVALKSVSVTYFATLERKGFAIKSFQIRVIGGVAIIATLVLITAMQPVAIALFGNEYMEGIWMFKWLVAINIVFFFQQLFNSMVVGDGRLLQSGIVGVVQGLAFLGLLLILIPRFRSEGYFLSYAISYALALAALMLLELRGAVDHHTRLYGYLLSIGILAIALVLWLGLFHNNSWGIAVQILTVIIFSALFYLKILNPVEKSEIQLVLAKLKR